MGTAFTGGSALATFTAVWDSINFKINISATNTSSIDTIQVKVIATEIRS
jgi:hypothetical protein